MAVGTIASLSVSASTTSIAISFAKPANCTKVIFTLTPKNPLGSTISKTYALPAGSAGTQLTYNFTGLLSTQKYTLSATPYNGSTAGTASSRHTNRRPDAAANSRRSGQRNSVSLPAQLMKMGSKALKLTPIGKSQLEVCG